MVTAVKTHTRQKWGGCKLWKAFDKRWRLTQDLSGKAGLAEIQGKGHLGEGTACAEAPRNLTWSEYHDWEVTHQNLAWSILQNA